MFSDCIDEMRDSTLTSDGVQNSKNCPEDEAAAGYSSSFSGCLVYLENSWLTSLPDIRVGIGYCRLKNNLNQISAFMIKP